MVWLIIGHPKRLIVAGVVPAIMNTLSSATSFTTPASIGAQQAKFDGIALQTLV
jgi:hypothetical protein